jgi:hypothetical protein
VNRQPGLKRLELRIELTYYLQVARTGEVVGGFDIVLKRVRDLDRKGEGEGAELIVGVGPVGDLFAKSLLNALANSAPVKWSPAMLTVLPMNLSPRRKMPSAVLPKSSAAIAAV